MIGYLKGTVSHLFAEYCFVDVQGVGYRVFIPHSTREKLTLGAQISLYTYLNVRDDALILFGFYTPTEYDLFMHLIGVTGIGPKVAVNILSNVKPNEFYLSIGQKRLDFLTKIPGIGKKTAERMILELKDKISIETIEEIEEAEISENNTGKTTVRGSSAKTSKSLYLRAFEDAVAALTSLGYNQSEASLAVREVIDKDKENSKDYSTQQLIKLALKSLKKV